MKVVTFGWPAKMIEMKFQCYCCGEEVDGVIALITMSDRSVDRVFVMKPEHTERVEEVNVTLVERSVE